MDNHHGQPPWTTTPLDDDIDNIDNIDNHVVDVVTIGKRCFGRRPLWTTTSTTSTTSTTMLLMLLPSASDALDDNLLGRQLFWIDTSTTSADQQLGAI
jgi:hypothetical protein